MVRSQKFPLFPLLSWWLSPVEERLPPQKEESQTDNGFSSTRGEEEPV